MLRLAGLTRYLPTTAQLVLACPSGQASDPNFGWDGMLNGQPMNSQVFVYTAVVVFADGTEEVFKGDFVLMR